MTRHPHEMTRWRAWRTLGAIVVGTLSVCVGSLTSDAQPPSPAPSSEHTAPTPADPVEQCVAAHLATQRLRQRGELTRAKHDALRCVAEECPPPIRAECGSWLAEIDQQLPTLVVQAIDASGHDTVRARLMIDDALVAEQLDGLPIALDPGEHKLSCEHDGQRRLESVVLVQGQKNRVVRCVFAVAAPPPAPAPDDGPPLGQLVAGSVLGVLGVGGLATFVGLGIVGQRDAKDLMRSCGEDAPAPLTNTCTQAQIDPVQAELVGADVSLGVGVGLSALSLGLLIHYFVTTPADPSASLRVDGGVSANGGAARLTFSF